MARCNFKNDKIFIFLLKSGLFEVSKKGKIFNTKTERYLGEKPNSRGYGTVCYKYKSRVRTIQAHRLIWIALNGPITDPEAQVNHRDGIKMNNHPSNHELTNGSGNTQHAFDNKLIDVRKFTGSKNGFAKLNEKKVIKIKKLIIKQVPLTQIALKFDVSKVTISNIKNNKQWKHVTI